MRSAQLVNRKQFYGSISRPRHDARVYTDDAEAIRRAVSREPHKEIALDAVKQRPTQEFKLQQKIAKLWQQQSMSMRIKSDFPRFLWQPCPMRRSISGVSKPMVSRSTSGSIADSSFNGDSTRRRRRQPTVCSA